MIINSEHCVLTGPTLGGSYEGIRKKGMALLNQPLEAIGVAPPEFVFLIEKKCAAPAGYRWVPPREALQDDRLWSLYTRFVLGGYIPPAREIEVFSFGNTPFMASRLAHLVAKGKKRSTSGNPEVLKKVGMAIPWPGLISIVTDGFGIPICAIETERIERRKFRDVPESVAIGEGEGDLSLTDWREGHWRYFASEAKSHGLPFTEDSEIVTEWFQVVKILGA